MLGVVRHYRCLLGFCLAFALAACSPPPPTFNGTDVTGIGWGGDVTLRAHTGDRVSTDDLRGRLVILFFGFTHCPDICSPTLAKLAALRKALEAESDQVRVVFVTVDPARDTVEQFAGFLSKFDPSFIGLTGTPEEIAAAAREYKVAYVSTPQPEHGEHAGHGEHAHPRIDHSGTMFVKDKAGNLRLLWRNEISVADMAQDVRLLLKLSS